MLSETHPLHVQSILPISITIISMYYHVPTKTTLHPIDYCTIYTPPPLVLISITNLQKILLVQSLYQILHTLYITILYRRR